MIFCLKLMSMHFLAVSHGYIMSYKFADDFILINYEYLLLDHASYPGKIIRKDCI